MPIPLMDASRLFMADSSSAHTNQDHPRTQPRIMRTHKSVSSAHTYQDHLRTSIRTPNQSSSVRGVGWGGVGIITNLAAWPGLDNYTGQTFLSTNIFWWVGWGGVGWGGDNNKPCRLTRTSQIHRADFPFYHHLIMGGMGWGGVGIITNLAAWPGPDKYTGHTFLSTNILSWVGWGGVGDNNKPCCCTRTWQLHRADFPFYQHLLMGGMGWGGVGVITNLAAWPGPHKYTGQTFLSTNILSWVGWGGVGWGGDNNKPCRLTRTWQIHRAHFPFYQHLIMGGVGWGGVGIITNLAAWPGPDNYTRQTFLSTNIFLWVGWGGVNNKPGRLTRTSRIHRAVPFYQSTERTGTDSVQFHLRILVSAQDS